MINDELFYAWLAGFIDGEGCFQLFKHKNPKAKRGFTWGTMLSIGQANKGLLERLKDKIGFGSFITQTVRHSHVKHPSRIAYRIDLSSGQIRKLLPLIMPYLRRKKKDATLIKQALKLLSHKGHSHHYDNDTKLEEIYHELRLCHEISGRKIRKWK